MEALASVALVDDLTQGSPLAAHYIPAPGTANSFIKATRTNREGEE